VLFYTELFTRLRRRFVEQDRMDVSQSFRRLMEAGHLEIITCGATHGYFPLLAVNEESLYAQLSMAVRTHERILGRRPRGIWLPECGYKPGVDRILKEFGIDFFILDSHGLLNAERAALRRAPPDSHARRAGRVCARLRIEQAGVVGGRRLSGDHLYREFYRDAGFDVHQPHIEKLRHAGIATFTGLKYHRITGKTAWKEPYHPGWRANAPPSTPAFPVQSSAAGAVAHLIPRPPAGDPCAV